MSSRGEGEVRARCMDGTGKGVDHVRHDLYALSTTFERMKFHFVLLQRHEEIWRT
jgi:hypothetical protein